MRDGFWMDPRQKEARFFQYLNNIDSCKDMNEFLADCEKDFSNLYVF